MKRGEVGVAGVVPAVFIQMFSLSRNVKYLAGGPEVVTVLTPEANETRIFRDHPEQQGSPSGPCVSPSLTVKRDHKLAFYSFMSWNSC